MTDEEIALAKAVIAGVPHHPGSVWDFLLMALDDVVFLRERCKEIAADLFRAEQHIHSITGERDRMAALVDATTAELRNIGQGQDRAEANEKELHAENIELRAVVERQGLHITHLVMAHRGHDWHAEVLGARAERDIAVGTEEQAKRLIEHIETENKRLEIIVGAASRWYDCSDAEEVHYLNDLANAIENMRAKEALSDG